MANKESAKKEMRKSRKKRIQNKSTLSKVRTFAKKCLVALSEGNEEKSVESIRMYQSLAAKAAKKNILNSRAVSRKVSRLTLKLKTLSTSKE